MGNDLSGHAPATTHPTGRASSPATSAATPAMPRVFATEAPPATTAKLFSGDAPDSRKPKRASIIEFFEKYEQSELEPPKNR